MPTSQKLLTTKEFSKIVGVSTGTVSKWLRSGKLEGTKRNGKWMIADSEVSKAGSRKSAANTPAPTAQPIKKTATPMVEKSVGKTAPQKSQAKSYSIEEFSAITYLTEFGVRKWLKEGRLKATTDSSGIQMVDADSLEIKAVKRLVR